MHFLKEVGTYLSNCAAFNDIIKERIGRVRAHVCAGTLLYKNNRCNLPFCNEKWMSVPAEKLFSCVLKALSYPDKATLYDHKALSYPDKATTYVACKWCGKW